MTLKLLHIQNIILIENASIDFEEGFNVLSGETGSGKSAILEALNLIVGERADASLIRRGSDKGIVEATFDIERLQQIKCVLEEAGIDHDSESDLIIRREILNTGKSRAFINHQVAQVSLLRQVGELLLDVVGQHANQKLLSLDHHRYMLDLYGNLDTKVEEFEVSWANENEIRQQLEFLISSEAERLREIEVCRMEQEELEKGNLKENEDEELFKEYTLLANSEELQQKVNEILQGVLLTQLNRLRPLFNHLVRIDNSLSDTASSFENAFVEFQEVSFTLERYLENLEHNPTRMEEVDRRLSELNKLKKKYGSTIAEIKSYQTSLAARLQKLENGDVQIENLQKELAHLEKKNHCLAKALTQDRQKAAKALSQAVKEELRLLNMPKADFSIDIVPQKRSKIGDDRVEFFLAPNIGENRISIKDAASGGELSRVMLALQALLAGKASIPTILFDEIDANIGGATATVIGEKLRQIALKHQVLCITHFPQVAKSATHHFQIAKQEVGGRTISSIKCLDPSARKEELARMQGKDKIYGK